MRNERRSEGRPSSQRWVRLGRLHATNLPEYFQVVRVHSTSFGELGAPFASLNLCDSN